MKQVIFRREARADALEAYRWYDQKEPGLGAAFRSELSATIQRVRQSPRAYRILFTATRGAPVSDDFRTGSSQRRGLGVLDRPSWPLQLKPWSVGRTRSDVVIARSEMVPMLLQSCPSFATTWREYVGSSGFDPELHYVHLGELARHLVGLAKQEERTEFDALFVVIERLHVEGDSYVREAATVGLLEGIQNIASHEQFDPDAFRPHLLPESLKWWDKLNRFWAGEPCALRK